MVDKVKYFNLIVGKKYVMTGTLMDKTAKAPILDKNQKPITASQEFTPDKADGVVDVTFEFDSNTHVGKPIVAFESLKRYNIELVTHADINDEDQTVYISQIKTTLTSEKGLKSILASDKTSLVDKVEYKGLIVGKKYKMVGKLVSKDGDKVNDATSEVSLEFTPKESNGFVDVKFELNTKKLAGLDLVAFERLELDGNVVAKHEDINDKGQTVSIPSIKTKAIDEKSQTQQLSDDGETITVVDKVSYKNLAVGNEYEMTGTLMDKKTGKALMVDGKEVKASTKFTPDKLEGTVELKFSLKNKDLNGKTLVVFEKVTLKGEEVANHEDIEDKDQSVYKLLISTLATGEDGKTKLLDPKKSVTVKDKVTYDNLVLGDEYKVEGILVDKATGKEVA